MTTLSCDAAAFLKLSDGTTPFLGRCSCLARGSPVLACRWEYVGSLNSGDFNEEASARIRLASCSELCDCQGAGTVVRDVTEGEVEQALVSMGYVYQAGFRMVDGYWYHVWRTDAGDPYGSMSSFADTPMGALNAAIEQVAGEA